LNVLEFNSTRKIMSIIAENDGISLFLSVGVITIVCKGADSIIWKLMKDDVKYKKETIELIEKFGADGLRTLLCPKRVISRRNGRNGMMKYLNQLN
jgi:magnesium-transporting ATPase (P-type)